MAEVRTSRAEWKRLKRKREGAMKYVKEEQFVTVTGQSFAINGVKGDAEAKTDAASMGEVLHWLAASYNPQLGVQLNLPDLRKLNKAIDVLEAAPENGLYAFEDADFNVLKKVAPQIAVYLSPRNAPLVEDALNGATGSVPQE